MNDKEVRYFQVTELRIEGEQEKRLRGHAAVFNSDSVDLGGFVERIAPGAFSRTIRENPKIHAYWNHDPGIPLGTTLSGKLALQEDERGLVFDLSAKRLTPAQLDAVEDGDMQMSFKFRKIKDAWEKRDGVNIRTLLDVDLFEVSLVAEPAYPATDVALRSLEEWNTETPEPVAQPYNTLRAKITLASM